MSKINFILQGKGGVGKSFVAALLAQYHQHTTETLPLCIDTDPVNATFHGFKKLNVKRLEIIEDEEINPRLFDNLIETVINHLGDSIIDNGASSFVPLSHYLVTNNVPDLLLSLGHEMIVHTIITGGQSQSDTINGMAALIKQMPNEAKIIVWLNPYFGNIEKDGNAFNTFKIYQSNKERITSLITMPSWKKETFGHDVSAMLQSRLTFDEAISLGTNNIMTKQRLKMAKTQLFTAIEG
jgi:CobQ/CobB/MinD/ParA nucleotide binding domain